MRKRFLYKTAAACVCLFAAFCLTVLGANPAGAAVPKVASEVTWEFGKIEKSGGKYWLLGLLTNHSKHSTLTGVDKFLLECTINGKQEKIDGSAAGNVPKPIPPGGKGLFLLPFIDPTGLKLENFKLTVLAVKSERQARQSDFSLKPRQADPDLDRVSIKKLKPELDGENYVRNIAVYNNSNKALTRLTLQMQLLYNDGEMYDKVLNWPFKKPVLPNGYVIVMFKPPHRGMQGAGDVVGIVKGEFAPPQLPEREYGPRKGNIVWTGSSVTTDKKGYDVLATSLLNNSAEDIVAINTYTVSFDHDNGRAVLYKNTWPLTNPIMAYKKSSLPILLARAGVFDNPRNFKISDVTYMSRPTSARPASRQSASSGQSASPGRSSSSSGNSSSPDARAKVLKVVPDKNAGQFVIVVEVLNNSSSQTLVRIDDPTIVFTMLSSSGKSKKQQVFDTMTVNIPPLGVKRYEFRLSKAVRGVDDNSFAFRGTYRFADPPRKRR